MKRLRKSAAVCLLAALCSGMALQGCQFTPDPGKVKAEVITSGFIYEEAPFPQCHASTLTETSEGLLAAWFGGTHEKNPDVCIYTSSLEGGKWKEPRMVADGVVSDTLRYPCWNPVLFQKDNGEIVLFYKVGPSPREWWGLYKISADGGYSWSEATLLPDRLLGPIKNKPGRLPDGTILCPTSFETPEMWRVYVETTSQDLTKWEKTGIDNNGFNAIQPTILFYRKGRIQMLCRSKEKKITETWSDDMGKTWTPLQATTLVNNNSGIDGVTLHNQLQLLVCNPIENGRNKLSLLASADGIQWKEIMVIEDQPEGEFSYPAIIQAADKSVHITYTWNRRKVKHVQLAIR